MSKNQSDVVSEVDPEKREFIGKLIRTTVFAAPMVASFSLAVLTKAEAQVANGSLPT